jgi:hypothetical protein
MYRHLTPIVIVVALLAGAAGAFFERALTDPGDVIAARLEELEERTRDIEAAPGLVFGKRIDATLVGAGGVPVPLSGLVVTGCPEGTQRIEGVGLAVFECDLTIAHRGRTLDVLVNDACYQRIRVGDRWPSEWEECR